MVAFELLSQHRCIHWNKYNWNRQSVEMGALATTVWQNGKNCLLFLNTAQTLPQPNSTKNLSFPCTRPPCFWDIFGGKSSSRMLPVWSIFFCFPVLKLQSWVPQILICIGFSFICIFLYFSVYSEYWICQVYYMIQQQASQSMSDVYCCQKASIY